MPKEGPSRGNPRLGVKNEDGNLQEGPCEAHCVGLACVCRRRKTDKECLWLGTSEEPEP